LVLGKTEFQQDIDHIASRIFKRIMEEGIDLAEKPKVHNYSLLLANKSFIESQSKSPIESVRLLAEVVIGEMNKHREVTTVVGIPLSTYVYLTQKDKESLIRENINVAPVVGGNDEERLRSLKKYQEWFGAGRAVVLTQAIDLDRHFVDVTRDIRSQVLSRVRSENVASVLHPAVKD
jgi:hypothetical protein